MLWFRPLLLAAALVVCHGNEETYAHSLAITLARARRNAVTFARATRAGWQPTDTAQKVGLLTPERDGCSEAGYEKIEELALNLTAAAKSMKVGFGSHGQWGIFDKGYLGVKTRFINKWLCRLQKKRQRPVRTICELGFMAGHSALLFLETVPSARVISFDMADNRCGGTDTRRYLSHDRSELQISSTRHPRAELRSQTRLSIHVQRTRRWTLPMAALLRAAYGSDRFELVPGLSNESVTRYGRRRLAPARATEGRLPRPLAADEREPCDVVFVDGAKHMEVCHARAAVGVWP
eukprot:6890258-Prymnesium_polylepis.1